MSVWETFGIVLMPVTYGFVGWLTNATALTMTLYPLKFRGIRPFFGWQGIVPRRARGLALTAIKLLTEHVVKVEELFARVKPRQLERMYAPVLDERMPDLVRRELAARGQDLSNDDVEKLAAAALAKSHAGLQEVADRLEQDASGAFNFRALVMRNVTGDNVKHLVHLFASVGAKEFAFIRRSGWLFGGLLGILQVGLWMVFPHWWTLPIQGAFVGGITNSLALLMIFRPLRERRLLGIRYQGLFLKRQEEVAEKYAALFAERVMSPRSIMEEVLHRPMARRVAAALDAEIAAHTQTPPADDEARRASVNALVDEFAESSQVMEKLVGRAMNVEKLIGGRLKELPPEEFETILRSAFKQDEYILILLGAVFGTLVGLVQGLYMLSF